jgi:hypothetical protein
MAQQAAQATPAPKTIFQSFMMLTAVDADRLPADES